MKNFLKILEENSKWVVRVLVGVGIIFMVKLWLIGLDVSTSCGGGYISLCFGFDIKYYWTNAGYIALVLILISVFLIFLIKNTENKIRKLKIAVLIFILGIIGKQIFFLVSPDFKFYLTPVTSQYKDKEGKITNIDNYLELVGKYCNNSKDDFNFIYSREDMCGGKFETDFKTVEEYIKVLNFAKNHNFRYLYQSTVRWVDDNIGIDNLIENYNDDTFYAYILLKGELLRDKRDKLAKVVKNEKILDLIKFYNDSILENQLLDKKLKNHNIDRYWKEFDNEYRLRVKRISEVNYNIF